MSRLRALRLPILCGLRIGPLLLPGALTAQQIEMRSGEHGGFTRLVLDLPAGLGWQGAATAEDRYRVDLERGGFDIGLGAVFHRIDQARVAEVTALPGGTGVEIVLACDCVVDSSGHEGRMAVFDIRPRRADEPLPGIAAGSDAPLVQAPALVSAPHPDPDLAPAAGLDLGLLPGASDAAGARALLPSFDPGPRLAAELATPEADREIAESFGRSLAEQLALGATQGLLEADGPRHSLPQARQDAAQDEPERHPSAKAQDGSVSAELLSGSTARGFGASSVLRIGGQRACLDDRRLDLPGWFGEGGEGAALARIGTLRGRLLGEFDRIDAQVQRELAQLYIALGFGAEARALLQLDDDLPDPVLMTLATLSEGGGDPAGVFAGQSECPGRAALWGVLGAKGLPVAAEIATPAIMAAFEELPLGLRRLLGPRLAERLLEEGEPDAARNVLSRLARALGRSTEDMQLVDARLARASGNPDAAATLLSGLLAAPGDLGVAAAVESIDLATHEGRPVAPGMVDLTAAYSTERRSTEARDELWLAHIRAAWANGEFDRAFAEIGTPEEVPAETRSHARTEVLSALTSAAEDGKFLRYALDPDNLALAPAEPALALTIADRLLALGLPEAAGRWMSGPAPPGKEHDWRLMQARRALAQQQPEEAEIALVGLQGDDVLRLRAAAREAMGDYEFARAAYVQLGDVGNAARLAWLAGDLAAAASGSDPVLADAAALASGGTAPPVAGAPTLTQGKELADSGQATIDTIRALLADRPAPEM
ncbi:hypothetical protein [Salipiger mangrovisoli]|uniref:Uncharacterized protein n=1 Tax=Salipiger mangrovisoli TaxID=2865933 RepID=A0ABR9WXB1_9RHOB|nr:hypothetical protein [Salipiger mangrovisoli]MBE9635918.1 hypothetical protein [Salipiger mangrovisoli]